MDSRRQRTFSAVTQTVNFGTRMIAEFTAAMQEAYRKYGDDEEIVHSVMDGIMCETLEKLGFAKGVEIFDETPKWYA